MSRNFKKQRSYEDFPVNPRIRTAVALFRDFEAEALVESNHQSLGRLLINLQTGYEIGHVFAAIKTLETSLNKHEGHSLTKVIDAAQCIVQNHSGVRTIMCALRKWYKESKEFTQSSIYTLHCIAYYHKLSVPVIVGTDGIDVVVTAAKEYPSSVTLAAYACGLLGNIAVNERTRQEVANDECIDFVLNAMKIVSGRFQAFCCEFFVEIGKIKGIREKLKQKQIGSFLAKALETFRATQDEVAYEVVNSFMRWYMG
jgi:hypothetical protein